MTREEIKQHYSMYDLVVRYGFSPTRSGFIPCPFHKGDRTASLKLYEQDFHCHACGANGDIFTFVQRMDGLSFKEAFLSLGGEYQKPTFSSNLAIYRAKKQREMMSLEAHKIDRKRRLNATLITVYRRWIECLEPLSDAWCDCANALQYQLYLLEALNTKKEAR